MHSGENNNKLIEELKKVRGALSYDSDSTAQVLLPTKDEYLRVGVSDYEDKEGDFVWFDYCNGLNNEIVNYNTDNKIKEHLKKRNYYFDILDGKKIKGLFDEHLIGLFYTFSQLKDLIKQDIINDSKIFDKKTINPTDTNILNYLEKGEKYFLYIKVLEIGKSF